MFTITTNQEFGQDEVYTVDVDADSFHQDEALVVFEKTDTPDAASHPDDPAPTSGPFKTRRVVAGFPIHAVVAILEKKEA
ncbi:hypothetical protein [Nocardioides alkalitolerans]|uniref:hypothetical protein n=1 Tax=Nocardioides alkalitolerans TaxID=281714 RepID=UPI00040589B7|nr:hypothetical protein [Nocardioides alkalitolerans]